MAAAHRIKRERIEIKVGRAARIGTADVDDIVARDPLRRSGVFAQPGGLRIKEAPGLISREAVKIEQGMRAWAIEISRIGDANLLETIVLQTPKRRAPF